MNITIHRSYIETVLGKENLEEFLMFVAINRFVLRNIIPWVGVLIVMMNMLVVLFSMMVYIKETHKPAFLFIGTLAAIDVLLGGYCLDWQSSVLTISFSGVH